MPWEAASEWMVNSDVLAMIVIASLSCVSKELICMLLSQTVSNINQQSCYLECVYIGIYFMPSDDANPCFYLFLCL